MPLIEAGKYDFSYNQKYLLAKFWNLEIYRSIFWHFWIALFLCILMYVVIKKLIFLKNIHLKKKSEEERDEVFTEFRNICRLIHEDLNTFNRSQKLVDKIYNGELKDLIFKMSKMESHMKKKYRNLIPDYEYYRLKLIKDEINEIDR